MYVQSKTTWRQFMQRTLIISDIHGELKLFNKLLGKINYNPDKDKLILLGDYIDRGPDSKGVLNRVMELKKQGAIVIRGNHDEMMLTAVDDKPDARKRWERAGALSTLKSYDSSINSMELPETDEFKEHVSFIREMDYFYEQDNYIFVHAGVRPDILFEENKPSTFLWIREQFYEKYSEYKTVVFGHTPVSNIRGKKDYSVYFGENNIIGIDGAATYGGQLNCLELPGRKTYHVKNNKLLNIFKRKN